MFSSIQSAKRKVITFGDDGEQVSRPTATAPTKAAAIESSSSASSKKHNVNNNDTQNTNGKVSVQEKASSTSSSATIVSSTSPDSDETGQRLSKKQKRQLQHQNDARPRKLINKEPTTEAMTLKAKELKKHRISLPIYTGKPMIFVYKEAYAKDMLSFSGRDSANNTMIVLKSWHISSGYYYQRGQGEPVRCHCGRDRIRKDHPDPSIPPRSRTRSTRNYLCHPASSCCRHQPGPTCRRGSWNTAGTKSRLQHSIRRQLF